MVVNADTNSLSKDGSPRPRPRRSLTARFVMSILLISLVTGGIGLVLVEIITSDVRETLEDIGLASEHTGGQLTPTPRAAGYCADPKSFELG